MRRAQPRVALRMRGREGPLRPRQDARRSRGSVRRPRTAGGGDGLVDVLLDLQ